VKVESKRAKSSQRKIRTTTVTWLREHGSHVVAPLLLGVLRTTLRVLQRQERKAAKRQAWLDDLEKHRPEVKRQKLHYEELPLEGMPKSKWQLYTKTVLRAGNQLSPRTKKSSRSKN